MGGCGCSCALLLGKALTVGAALGARVGHAVGPSVGLADGLDVGVVEGDVDGLTVGAAVGLRVGNTVGIADGLVIGLADGTTLGLLVGATVGLAVMPFGETGLFVGEYVGAVDGGQTFLHVQHAWSAVFPAVPTLLACELLLHQLFNL